MRIFKSVGLNRMLLVSTILLSALLFLTSNFASAEVQSPVKMVKVSFEAASQTNKYNKQDFVRLSKLDKTIVQDLRYATKNNFTHKKQYDFDHVVLRKATAQKLVKANTYLKKKYGYRIKVWDAYRPYSVQKAFWNYLPNANYVARPTYTSNHVLGVGVDVTLVDKNGKELNMPTKFDDFRKLAWRDSKLKWTKEQQRNCSILTEAMQRSGFDITRTEWWDYKDRDRAKYKYVNIDPNKI